MTTEQLQYFLIAAKHLNFSTTAKELYVTQPAISHQIASLEKELGTQLFVRSTRKVRLTKSGELFLEDAKRILDLAESAKTRINLADNSSDLSLSIAYLLSPCQSFLPKIVLEFHKQYPQVEVHLTRMDAHEITNDMKHSNRDLYFSLTRDFLANPKYAYKDIFTDTFCLICSNEHPCVSTPKIDFDKLASERFLILDPEIAPYMTKQIQEIWHSYKFVPHTIRKFSTMEEILFEAEAGMGISILPLKNKFFTPSTLVYLPLSGNHCQTVMGVAWLHHTDNPAISWFLETMDQVKAGHPEWF